MMLKFIALDAIVDAEDSDSPTELRYIQINRLSMFGPSTHDGKDCSEVTVDGQVFWVTQTIDEIAKKMKEA